MVRVGLTGNYGSGKSTALAEFRREGAFTLSADDIVASLLEEPEVIAKVRAIIGQQAVNSHGGADKRAIAKAIFSDDDARFSLESLLHPLVLERIEGALSHARAKVAVVEVPLLFEAKMEGRFDRTVVVVSGRNLAAARLQETGVSSRAALARRRAQWREAEKVRRADYVIVNRSGHDALASQVAELMPRLSAPMPKPSDVIRGLRNVDRSARGMVVSIGNFDGVHAGHRRIISTAANMAADLDAGVMALTFDPHPIKVLAPERDLRLLCTPEDRASLLMRAGAERVLFVPFTREFASMDAEEFIEGVLVGRLGVRGVVVGHGYTFGKGRKGTTELLRRRGKRLGFKVRVVRSVSVNGEKASSSRVRNLLNWGRVCEASTLLGRAYSIHGTVIKGAGRGSSILGIPTANIQSQSELVPKKGVYAVRAELDGVLYDAAANIGDNPTFKGAASSQEVHIIDFKGDLLGRELRMHFIDRIREEKAFSSVDALRTQIYADIEHAREILRAKGRRCTAFNEPS